MKREEYFDNFNFYFRPGCKVRFFEDIAVGNINYRAIFHYLMYFGKMIFYSTEERFNGRCLSDLFSPNSDRLETSLFAQYMCSLMEFEGTNLLVQLFSCLHCQPMMEFFER